MFIVMILLSLSMEVVEKKRTNEKMDLFFRNIIDQKYKVENSLRTKHMKTETIV